VINREISSGKANFHMQRERAAASEGVMGGSGSGTKRVSLGGGGGKRGGGTTREEQKLIVGEELRQGGKTGSW